MILDSIFKTEHVSWKEKLLTKHWWMYIVKFWMHTPSPWASKFFQFHAVFWRIWQNCVFMPPLEGSCPHLGEILDLPLLSVHFHAFNQVPLIAINLKLHKEKRQLVSDTNCKHDVMQIHRHLQQQLQCYLSLEISSFRTKHFFTTLACFCTKRSDWSIHLVWDYSIAIQFPN